MSAVKEYCELEAVARFYQFEQMKFNNYATRKEKKEHDRLYNIWIKKLKELDEIRYEKQHDYKFWDAVDSYRYAHADKLINAGETFNLV